MAEEMPKLEIFGDSPTTEDGLGFDDYANILLELVGNFDARSPLTVGIHGRWGSGKTSLMRMLEKRFGDDKGVKTVWFNAWAYGRDEPIGLALLQQILNEFQKEEKLKEKGEELLKNVIELGTDAFLRRTTAITLKEAKDHFKSSTEIKSTLRSDFESVIDECLQDGKLVVFIDDLDRCLPEKTIEILEVIKLFLDVPKCIFVIGVEKEVIERGIEVRYKSKEQKIPISGQDYIEKIIQIPFVLPPIREDDMTAFIENLGIEKREKGYVTIVAKYTGCNPRKVKLFLNVLRIRRAIAERTGGGIEPDRSAKLFVFEYVFPEFYRDVVKYKDQELLCKLERLAIGDSDEKLEEELESSELLKKYHKNENLKSLLTDKPFFCGKDIEPCIYLSGAGAPEEVTVSDESILDELLSGDSMERSYAADTINKMPDSEKQQVLNVVISKLKDENASVRGNAARALGEIGGARAVEALKGVLKKDGGYIRRVAEDLEKDLENRDGIFGAGELLARALEIGYAKNARRSAVGALGRIGDAGAVEALKEALKDEDADVRYDVGAILVGIGGVRAVEVLKEALKDGNASVRDNAVGALGRIGDAGAVEALKEALKDENASVRGKVVGALGRIGDAGAVEALEEALKDGNAYVHGKATKALGKIKAKQNQ